MRRPRPGKRSRSFGIKTAEIMMIMLPGRLLDVLPLVNSFLVRLKSRESDSRKPIFPRSATGQIVGQYLHEAVPACHFFVNLYSSAVTSGKEQAYAINDKPVALKA